MKPENRQQPRPAPNISADMNNKSGRYHGWWVVFCCFVVALYGWGFGFYGLSLYVVALNRAWGWSPATVSTAITFYYVVGAFLVMQTGDLIHRVGARIVVMAGLGLMVLGVIGLTWVREPWQLYLAFSVMVPGWAAMGGAAINTTIALWFDHRRGLAASLALSGATCGGLFFAPALAWAIDTRGFSFACWAAAIVACATLWPLAAFTLRPRRADEREPGDGETAHDNTSGVPLHRNAILREPRYLTMVGAFSLGLLAQISFIAHQAAFLEPMLGLKGAGWAISATSLAALVGRFAVGLVIDRIDRRAATAAVLLGQVAAMLVLLSTQSVVGLYFGCMMFGFGVGNLITLPGLIVQTEFARRDFARAVSLNVAITQLVAAAGPSLLGVLHELSGDYRTSLIACLILEVAAAMLVMIRPGRAPIATDVKA
jgi:MFS family permease